MKSKSLMPLAGISELKESTVSWSGNTGSDIYGHNVLETSASIEEFLKAILFKGEAVRSVKRNRNFRDFQVIESTAVGHTVQYRTEYSLGARDRSFVSKFVYKWSSPTSLMVVGVPTRHQNARAEIDTVQGELFQAYRITVQGEAEGQSNLTTVEWVYHCKHGGNVPNALVRRTLPLEHLGNFIASYRRVQNAKPAELLDEIDGRNMGELCMREALEERTVAGVSLFGIKQGGWHLERGFSDLGVERFCQQNVALKTFAAQHGDFLTIVLKEVCWNRVGPIEEVGLALKDLRSDDSKKIGRSFPAMIQNCVTKEGAVEEFIQKYPAMKEMEERYVWFRPMMLALATRAKAHSKIGRFMGCLGFGFWVRENVHTPHTTQHRTLLQGRVGRRSLDDGYDLGHVYRHGVS